ncbi:hypothetical protein PV325_000556 [Microctonus aethiopoides]|uniref:Uncharacterized protein n=1 Tax=Microctonus aethiopoides TaxID=144406 RepID=A0AA39F6R0_9HYME|nr:hypothetical protein PV325_000556 [Microctonus aethiopoides]KAK0094027.1 hypothetical protein PV326_012045 [Microctonus aethiopoides]KAK0163894.1 hypothetical protein PV328_002579 [Microctonus aethiopoides]
MRVNLREVYKVSKEGSMGLSNHSNRWIKSYNCVQEISLGHQVKVKTYDGPRMRWGRIALGRELPRCEVVGGKEIKNKSRKRTRTDVEGE